jgi:hypothetical protein
MHLCDFINTESLIILSYSQGRICMREFVTTALLLRSERTWCLIEKVVIVSNVALDCSYWPFGRSKVALLYWTIIQKYWIGKQTFSLKHKRASASLHVKRACASSWISSKAQQSHKREFSQTHFYALRVCALSLRRNSQDMLRQIQTQMFRQTKLGAHIVIKKRCRKKSDMLPTCCLCHFLLLEYYIGEIANSLLRGGNELKVGK